MAVIDEAFGLDTAALSLAPERKSGCLCSTCRYRCLDLARGGCNYALITGHCRSVICPRPEGDERHVSAFCTVYESGDPVVSPEAFNAPKPKKKRKPGIKRQRYEAASAKAFECYNAGGTDDQICNAAGRGKSWVIQWRHTNGLPIHSTHKPRRLSDETIERRAIAAEMYSAGATDGEINAALNVSGKWACEWRHRMGLPPNRKESR